MKVQIITPERTITIDEPKDMKLYFRDKHNQWKAVEPLCKTLTNLSCRAYEDVSSTENEGAEECKQ